MTETMAIEAVRAANAANGTAGAANGMQSAAAVADPAAVERFQAAMGAEGVQGAYAVRDADPVPFLSDVSASWRSAHEDNQDMLHRIRALARMGTTYSGSAPELIELQYEIMNLTFQQEIVGKVADKSSNAIQTLVKNQ